MTSVLHPFVSIEIIPFIFLLYMHQKILLAQECSLHVRGRAACPCSGSGMPCFGVEGRWIGLGSQARTSPKDLKDSNASERDHRRNRLVCKLVNRSLSTTFQAEHFHQNWLVPNSRRSDSKGGTPSPNLPCLDRAFAGRAMALAAAI